MNPCSDTVVSSIRNIAISNDAGSRSKAASPFQDYAKEALIFTESSVLKSRSSSSDVSEERILLLYMLRRRHSDSVI